MRLREEGENSTRKKYRILLQSQASPQTLAINSHMQHERGSFTREIVMENDAV